MLSRILMRRAKKSSTTSGVNKQPLAKFSQPIVYTQSRVFAVGRRAKSDNRTIIPQKHFPTSKVISNPSTTP
jgi:hypothetical protein